MSNFKILLTDGLEETGKSVLGAHAEVIDRPGISPEDLLKIISDFDALIVRGRTKVNAAVFEAGTRLKVVGRSGVGVDNIDLNAARQHQVTVVNAPVATTISVAELTIGLMLSIMREIPRADASLKAGKWLKKELEGGELFQKNLGIIGLGRIGAAVCTRAAAFGMTILGYDPLQKPETIREAGASPVSLEELYINSDVISIHVPLTHETRLLLNQAAFAKMKTGVKIVCTARGGIIDEDALLEALNTGKVAAAALDVFAVEPPGSSQLVTHPHIVATPHIGAQSIEAQQRAANDIVDEVLNALNGEPLRWKVA
jgi:D-3-phosphoglycerate dehydrogenase